MTLDPRLQELVGRYADGGATAEEVRELETALRSDFAFRRWFIQYLNIDAGLGSAVRTAEDPPAIARPSRFAGRRWLTWSAAAAAVLIVALGLWRLPSRSGDGVATSPTSPNVAAVVPPPPVLLIATTHARWADADAELSLRSGDLPAGVMRLEAGSAEFRFADGATAVVLGPASIQFPGPRQMFLQQGKALCRCPTVQSRITVSTPATQIVDLGTEFAVDVTPDETSTRVAVVSGEVRVGSTQPRVLRTGEAAVVGIDRVVRLVPLPAETLAELLAADSSRSPRSTLGPNLLADPDFTAAKSPWWLTEGHVDLIPESGGGGAAEVHARGHRFWPGVRQTIATADIAGRLVVASVEGTSLINDPLVERQSAVLKISFLDARGREFATASRHFLQTSEPPGKPVAARIAAFAPAGTQKVQMQLLLNARGQPNGSVRFDRPSLAIAAVPPTTSPASQPLP